MAYDDDFEPRRAPARGHGGDEAPARASLWRRIAGHNPGDRIAFALMAFVAGGIVVNALVRQNGPHPAPLFAAAVVAPAPAAPRAADVQQTASIQPRAPEAAAAAPQGRQRSDIVADVQRELQRRRLYEGAVDGVTGPKTEAAIRRFETEARLAVTGEASENLLARLRRAPATAAATAPATTAPAAARPAAPAPAARAPQGPQNIADLIERDPRARPAPRPASAPRSERSIGDLIAADAGRARP